MNDFKVQYANLGINDAPPTDPVQKFEVIYRAACTKLGLNPEDMPDVSRVREKYRASQLAFHKLEVVRDAIVSDREANYDDRNEEKWGGWFYLNKPGFRFDGACCGISYSCSVGGPRLCTFSNDEQEFFMKECVAGWADFYGGVLPDVE
jgi:hypothetical protein